MGFREEGVEFLYACREAGVDFGRTGSLGRHNLPGVQVAGLQRAAAAAGTIVSAPDARHILESADGWFEPLLRSLGADEVVSLDASDYEGATLVHDLNDPLPDGLKARFSAVVDSGTMEHVFNAPRALASAMELPELGGHLILVLPTNDEAGHGFYQFSPEFFYRSLTPANGYEVEEVRIREHGEDAWRAVADPDVLGRRSQYRTDATAYLYVRARRTALVTPFAAGWPQQSDYAAAWDASSAPADGEGRPSAPASPPPAATPFLRRAVASVRRRVRRHLAGPPPVRPDHFLDDDERFPPLG